MSTERPRTSDRVRPAPDPKKWAKRGMAMLRQEGEFASCSCGWQTYHRRDKVREDRMEAHANKRHGGQALWI